MFDHITDRQQVADMFKKLVLSAPGNRQGAKDAVTQLERADWHPAVMSQALLAIAPFGFEWKGEELTFSGEGRLILPAVRCVLETYGDILAGAPALFGTGQAAEYLGLRLPSVKDHIYKIGDLEGTLVGNSLTFTRRQLFQFETRRRPRGRRMKSDFQSASAAPLSAVIAEMV